MAHYIACCQLASTTIEAVQLSGYTPLHYMKKALLLLLTMTSIRCIAQVQTFANVDAAPCDGWDSGNDYSGFQRTINVSGLPVPMSIPGTVLRQVDLRMGSPACRGDLSTYRARLRSPQGTIIQLFDTFTVATTPQWFDIHYRAGNIQGDAPFLYPVREYPESVQQVYHPWGIGYYSTQSGDFSVLNGEDPNGDWTLELAEDATGEVSFEQVVLHFGPPVARNFVNSATSAPLDSCAGAVCMEEAGVYEMSMQNPLFQAPDPLYPGDVVNGCAWNGGNDLSAWFRFTATGTSAYISISKLVGAASSCPDNHRVQLLVVEAPGPLCSSPPAVVPAGGCPDPAAPGDNNSSYAFPNGGVLNMDDVYDAGISANCEFNLSGLTPGGNYYLLLDVCGPTDALRPYIEVVQGAGPCNFLLPVTWTGLDVTCRGGERLVRWSVASQTNNLRFVVERSSDAVVWEPVDSLPGAGTTQQAMTYELEDRISALERPSSLYYHRVRSVAADGSMEVSAVRASSCSFSIFPNPATTFLSASLPAVGTDVDVIDATGRIIRSFLNNGAAISVNISALATGYYTLRVSRSGEVLASGVFIKL